MKKGLFEIERILDRKIFSGKVLYKVKWKGFPQEESTWETIKVLSDAKELIKEYKDQAKGKISQPRQAQPQMDTYQEEQKPKKKTSKKNLKQDEGKKKVKGRKRKEKYLQKLEKSLIEGKDLEQKETAPCEPQESQSLNQPEPEPEPQRKEDDPERKEEESKKADEATFQRKQYELFRLKTKKKTIECIDLEQQSSQQKETKSREKKSKDLTHQKQSEAANDTILKGEVLNKVNNDLSLAFRSFAQKTVSKLGGPHVKKLFYLQENQDGDKIYLVQYSSGTLIKLSANELLKKHPNQLIKFMETRVTSQEQNEQN